MAKPKVNVTPTQTKPTYFICTKCGKRYKTTEFYANSSKPLGIIPVCKHCMYDFAIDSNGLNRSGLIDLCKYVDMPFLQSAYENTMDKFPTQPKRQLALYFNIGLNGKDGLHFNDSMFEQFIDYDEVEVTVDLGEVHTPGEVETPEQKANAMKKKTQYALELREKWGNFDSLEYLERCEKLYTEIVTGGYVIQSAMHELSVKNYVKIQIDWDIALETKNYEAMNNLKVPLKDARSDAKLNPSQFKPGDFNNGGANSFGEIARMVSLKDGFIPLPMKFYKQPTDFLDFMMWELVNYDRHVLGLEEVEYEEVYRFHIDKVNKFNEEYGADIENGDLGTLDPSTKGNKRTWTILNP